jgi:hypothetical protein
MVSVKSLIVMSIQNFPFMVRCDEPFQDIKAYQTISLISILKNDFVPCGASSSMPQAAYTI